MITSTHSVSATLRTIMSEGDTVEIVAVDDGFCDAGADLSVCLRDGVLLFVKSD